MAISPVAAWDDSFKTLRLPKGFQMHGLVFEGLLFFLHWRQNGRILFLAADMLTQAFHPLCQLLQLCMHNHLVDGPRFAFAMHDAVDKLFSCYFPITIIEKVEQGRALLQDGLNGCNFLSTHSLCSQHSHWWLSKWPNHYLSKKNSVHSKAGWISSCMLQPTCSGDSGQSLVCSKWDLLGSFKEASNTHECNFMRES